MTGPFNPLAGNFSTMGWLADIGDYNLKIVKVNYRRVGNENPKPVLSFTVAVADGPYANKRPAPIDVWEPESDFQQAGRVILAALGYTPGKDDGRFVQERGSMDFTLDSSGDEFVLGSGYTELEGCVFTATLGQKVSAKDGKTYQQYRNIRPLNG